MKKRILYIVAIGLFSIFTGCNEEAPTDVDGKATWNIYVVKQDTLQGGVLQNTPIPNSEVLVSSGYGSQIRKTDINGFCVFENIPSQIYNASVNADEIDGSNRLLSGSLTGKNVFGCDENLDTIFVKVTSCRGIKINEVYTVGPVNRMYYFYDQYVELYNNSDEVLYLDGMMISRVCGNSITDGHLGPGADEDSDGDIDGARFVYKFPGNPGEKNHPINPGQYVVIAADAIDHTKTVKGSVDLSNVDWEFCDQYQSTEMDNPNVPNLSNMVPDKAVDFMVGLTSDIIVLTDGTDANYADGFDINSVVDAISFKTKEGKDHTLDKRIDKSYALAPPSYSGKSLQRRKPGLDTDNAIMDWEVIEHPTPGFQN